MPSYHTEQRVRVGELLHITSARMSSKPQLLCIWGRGLEAVASFCDSRTSEEPQVKGQNIRQERRCGLGLLQPRPGCISKPRWNYP